MKKAVILVIAILAVSGLGIGGYVHEDQNPNAGLYHEKSYETIREGPRSHYNFRDGFKGARLVIRNEEDWEDFWGKHHGGYDPYTPELPDVDFNKDMVLIVIMGSQNTGGYSIEFKEVYGIDGLITVAEYKEKEPGPGAIVPMWGTNPYHMIVTEKTGYVLFSEARNDPFEDREGPSTGQAKTDLIST